jgi:Spy/CpxP family protein refolding chaperone
MKRILTLGFVAVLVVGTALSLHAQGPGFQRRGPSGMMHSHGEFLAKALDLSDEQKVAVQKLIEDLESKAQPLSEQHRQQMEEVHALLEGANPDPTVVGQKVIAAHASREQLEALHDDFKAKLSTLLTPDQLEKAKKLHDMHREHGPFGGEPGPER